MGQSQIQLKTGESGLVVVLTLMGTCVGKAKSPSQLEKTGNGTHWGRGAATRASYRYCLKPVQSGVMRPIAQNCWECELRRCT